jgi:hypothetical protein
MNDQPSTVPDAAGSASDVPDIRRRDGGSVDIEYYACCAHRLRSLYLTKLFALLFRCRCCRCAHLELEALDERILHDLGHLAQRYPRHRKRRVFPGRHPPAVRVHTDSLPNLREAHPMYGKAMLTLMADHNRWINEKLYAVCSSLSDEERKRDMGAFLRSIHGTLNHLLLLVDRLWLGRVTGQPFPIESLDQELHADFVTLATERSKTDARHRRFRGRIGIGSARRTDPLHLVRGETASHAAARADPGASIPPLKPIIAARSLP